MSSTTVVKNIPDCIRNLLLCSLVDLMRSDSATYCISSVVFQLPDAVWVFICLRCRRQRRAFAERNTTESWESFREWNIKDRYRSYIFPIISNNPFSFEACNFLISSFRVIKRFEINSRLLLPTLKSTTFGGKPFILIRST